MSVHLGDRDRVTETRVDGICEVYRSRSLGESDDIPTRSEDKYLIREDIHLHLVHEFTSSILRSDDSLDRLYPVAIFGFFARSRLAVLKVSSHSHLCLDMHIWRTDLYLCRLRSEIWKESNYSGMK